MIEEKRGFIGKKTSLSKEKTLEFSISIGIFDSKTTITDRDKFELFKYCEPGLAGLSQYISSISMSIIFSLNGIYSFTLWYIYEYLACKFL